MTEKKRVCSSLGIDLAFAPRSAVGSICAESAVCKGHAGSKVAGNDIKYFIFLCVAAVFATLCIVLYIKVRTVTITLL